MEMDILPVNIGLIVKADDLDVAKSFLARLERLLAEVPGMRPLYQTVSSDHLWVKRGEAPD